VSRPLYMGIICVTTPLYVYHLCHDPFIRVPFVSRPLHVSYTWICMSIKKSSVTRPLYTSIMWVTTPLCLIHMNIKESCVSRPLYCTCPECLRIWRSHVGCDPCKSHTDEYSRVWRSHVCRDPCIAHVQNVYVNEGVMWVATPLCVYHDSFLHGDILDVCSSWVSQDPLEIQTICDAWLLYTCVVAPSCVCHDSFIHLDILDICSSWVSHYPLEFKQTMSRISGTGMNNFELRCVVVCCSVL